MAARGVHLLRLGLLLLPGSLVVVRDGDVGLLSNLLLLLCGSGGLRLVLLPDEVAEAHHFVVDHLAHLLHVIDDLEVEVEGRWAGGFVGGVVPDVQVWVLQRLLDGNTRRRIKGQHAIEQIEGVRVGVGEQALEGDLGHERQVAHVFLSTGRSNAAESLLVGSTQVVQDLVELVDIVPAFEERTAAEQFGQDASYRPHVDYDCQHRRSKMVFSTTY